jgi:membrane protease YdiL (CAAX protease family)
MIGHDAFSKMYIVLAVVITLYLSTFDTSATVLFPSILLIAGLVMEFYTERKFEWHNEPITDEASFKTTMFYTVIALMAMLLMGYVIGNLKLSTFTGFDAVLYSVLIAISEEQFFRGFITDFMLNSLPNTFLALAASAGAFAVYHFARYGTNVNALAYVFAGGFILSWAAYKSRKLSPSMNGHIINNVGSFIKGVSALIGAG